MKGSRAILAGVLLLFVGCIFYSQNSPEYHAHPTPKPTSAPEPDVTPTSVGHVTGENDSWSTADLPDDDDNRTTKKFRGYTCTQDCSGHEAGYDWAERNDITDDDACDAAGERSNSPSFAEGCRAFVDGDSRSESESDNEDENPQ
jgi:hypothetical protein